VAMSQIEREKTNRQAGSGLSKDAEESERGVKWVYNWLFFSVFLTVPWMLVNIYSAANSYGASTFDWLRAALVPALPHLLLLKDRKSPYAFVRAHARQALLFAGIRAFSSAYFIGLLEGEGAVIWFFLNGFLWIFGTFWGRRQVKRGDCWLVRQGIWHAGGPLALPRPWALPLSQRPVETDKVLTESVKPVRAPREPVEPLTARAISQATAGSRSLNVAQIYNRANSLRDQGQFSEARSLYVTVFRDSSGSMRDKAITQLDKMGEIEVF